MPMKKNYLLKVMALLMTLLLMCNANEDICG